MLPSQAKTLPTTTALFVPFMNSHFPAQEKLVDEHMEEKGIEGEETEQINQTPSGIL